MRTAPKTPAPTERPVHPGVGILNREGTPVYYGHVRGVYFESPQLRAVESILEAQEIG